MPEQHTNFIIKRQNKNISIRRIIEQLCKYFLLSDNMKDTAQFALFWVISQAHSYLSSIWNNKTGWDYEALQDLIQNPQR